MVLFRRIKTPKHNKNVVGQALEQKSCKMQIILTVSVRLSLEKRLPFPHRKDFPHPWPGLSSESLWSVFFPGSLEWWRHWLSSHTDQAAHLKAGHSAMTVLCSNARGGNGFFCWELCWPLSVASTKEGVAENVKEAESVFRDLNFCSGNPISRTINYLLCPFRSLSLSQMAILWWDRRCGIWRW